MFRFFLLVCLFLNFSSNEKPLTNFKLNIQYMEMEPTHTLGPPKDPQLFLQVAVEAEVFFQALSCLDSQSSSALLYSSRATSMWPTHSCVLGQRSPEKGKGLASLSPLCCDDYPKDQSWDCSGFGGDRAMPPAGGSLFRDVSGAHQGFLMPGSRFPVLRGPTSLGSLVSFLLSGQLPALSH